MYSSSSDTCFEPKSRAKCRALEKEEKPQKKVKITSPVKIIQDFRKTENEILKLKSLLESKQGSLASAVREKVAEAATAVAFSNGMYNEKDPMWESVKSLTAKIEKLRKEINDIESQLSGCDTTGNGGGDVDDDCVIVLPTSEYRTPGNLSSLATTSTSASSIASENVLVGDDGNVFRTLSFSHVTNDTNIADDVDDVITDAACADTN
jgi:hypothetical protein